MKNNFVPTRNDVITIYLKLARNYGQDYQDTTVYIEEDWKNRFADWLDAIWPKYLQEGLNRMSSQYPRRSKRSKSVNPHGIKLSADEFDQLPVTAVHNLDMNRLGQFQMFEDYLHADMNIEMIRFFKYEAMKLAVNKAFPPQNMFGATFDEHAQIRKQILDATQKMCLEVFLKKDELEIYNGLIEKLDVNAKWG